MPNYFYADANGQKQGPVDEQQLQELIDQGVINPNTRLVTDTGHKGNAGQVPGLKFNTVSSPFTQTVSQMTVGDIQQSARSTAKSAGLWLFDFAFRDLRLHIFNLWVCRISYILWMITALLMGFWGTSLVFNGAGQFGIGGGPFAPIVTFLGIFIVWLSVLFSIVYVRLLLEWSITIIDWMVETTKAARIYIANNQNGQNNS